MNISECCIEWGECEITAADHECDNPRDHDGVHHCGYCGEETEDVDDE